MREQEGKRKSSRSKLMGISSVLMDNGNKEKEGIKESERDRADK
jgi:hypothetical protein